MKIKEKPCSGMNKAKGFEGCGEPTLIRKYGLCKSCLSKWYLTTPKGKEQLHNITVKVSKPRKDFEEYKEERKKTKSLQHWIDYTRQIVHAYINKRDKGRPCISCGQLWNNTFQAGHRYNKKQFGEIQFHLHNINGQCQYCNGYLEGNYNQYELRLPNRIGKDNTEALKRLADDCKTKVKKWTRQELKDIRTKIKQI